jgi:hypothetical protein
MVALGASTLFGLAVAQDSLQPKDPTPEPTPEPTRDLLTLLPRAHARAAESAAVAGLIASDAAGLFSGLALLDAGHYHQVWPPEKAPALLSGRLENVEDSKPVQSFNRNVDEHNAYTYVLYTADWTPTPVLARGARRDLTYAHLMGQPRKHRGQLVHVEGTLRQVRRFDPPADAKAVGVHHDYEGWIFEDGDSQHPWCVKFTELPPGVPVAEKLDVPVAFDGYFFKKYGYESAGRQFREVPLLIGHAPAVRQMPAEAGESGATTFGRYLLPGVFAVIASTALLILTLGWWFRRGDRRVWTRLEGTRDRGYPEPPHANSSDPPEWN